MRRCRALSTKLKSPYVILNTKEDIEEEFQRENDEF